MPVSNCLWIGSSKYLYQSRADKKPRRGMQPFPPTASSRVACPDLLFQILQYTSDRTLTRCMRVSRTLYQVAGAMMYRDIYLSHVPVNQLVRGADIVSRKRNTRTGRAVQNLKIGLLSYIKTLEFGPFQASCLHPSLSKLFDHLVGIETVRFVFPLSPTLLECDFCSGYGNICSLHGDDRMDVFTEYHLIGPSDDSPLADGIVSHRSRLAKLKARKVVFTSVQSWTCFDNLQNTFPDINCLTVVISPDTESVTPKISAAIRAQMDWISQSSPGAQLRLIITPWSYRTAQLAYIAREAWSDWEWRERARSADLIAFIAGVVSADFDTTV